MLAALPLVSAGGIAACALAALPLMIECCSHFCPGRRKC